jgi:serine phosphatase RsbU (regulator of sigma subunit)
VTDSIIELKGDKMPIAIHVKMDEFSQQDYQLVRGDTIYMFTDGFADQFGGKDKRKYMYKRFKELLIAFNNNTMNEQKEMLENELKEWIGEGEQIDDITVIGIRIE